MSKSKQGEKSPRKGEIRITYEGTPAALKELGIGKKEKGKKAPAVRVVHK
jgi:hypothetical protein